MADEKELTLTCGFPGGGVMDPVAFRQAAEAFMRKPQPVMMDGNVVGETIGAVVEGFRLKVTDPTAIKKLRGDSDPQISIGFEAGLERAEIHTKPVRLHTLG